MRPLFPSGSAALLIAMVLSGAPSAAQAQAALYRRAAGDHIKDQASAVLALMSYMVVPDVTTSSLSVSNADTGNPSLAMTQLGGGFTWSKSTPLYMEGNAAYVRFDPKFLMSNGTDTRDLPSKWNGVNVTVGLGWDFPIAKDLVVRPILMGSYGRIISDLQAGAWWVGNQVEREFTFLNGGKVKQRGAGASLMLDYERLRPERDLDLEVRYTHVQLNLHSDEFPDMNDSAKAESLNIWGRMRTPTRWMLLDRPVRSVLELTHSEFLDSQATELGFKRLTSIGVGAEIDTSAYDVFVTRGRLLVRYLHGAGAEGWSLGMAVSF